MILTCRIYKKRFSSFSGTLTRRPHTSNTCCRLSASSRKRGDMTTNRLKDKGVLPIVRVNELFGRQSKTNQIFCYGVLIFRSSVAFSLTETTRDTSNTLFQLCFLVKAMVLETFAFSFVVTTHWEKMSFAELFE